MTAERNVWKVLAVAAAVFALTVPATAHAQYFGQNKVQYQTFHFDVLKTEHFDIYYYPEENLAVEYAALMAERWYARLSRLLDHQLSGRQALILYASAPQFRQTNTLQGDIGEGTGGVTEILKRRIVLPFAGPLRETDHVLGHELVHAFQFDMTGEGGGIALAGGPSVLRYPLWFVEGMAEYLSLGPHDPNTAMWMRDAARNELPDVRKLSDPRFFPYRYGQSLWAYIGGRWGDASIGRILKAARSAPSAAVAFARVLRTTPDSIVAGWQRSLRNYYQPLQDETKTAADYGRAVITPENHGGKLNVGPELSPDGKRLVFISERDLFSIDIYLADAQTGKVIRRITNTAVSPHFESLQFIYSAGAWSRDGNRFAFAAIRKGRPVLTIIDPEKGDVLREIPLKDLGEIYNPTWSPDGNSIAFSALVGGLTDLYVYDLADSTLKRLTNDAYADLHPAWSPDGTTIAFVTDQFSTGLSSLLYGNYAIGLYDVRTGAIRPGPGFEHGKNINPQWSPDGRSLYFISDQNGISDVYRADVATGQLYQVTNLYTGVSGITNLSPALSIAASAGTMAFSAYEKDVHSIYMVDDPQTLAGGPVAPAFANVDPAQLPPPDRASNDVATLVTNAFYGLPTDTSDYVRTPYHPRFALDYVGQPTLAAGVDAYGSFIAGGASLFWSDELGGHNLATALGFQGRIQDISALVAYQNLNRRLNWGLVAQQTPYIYGYGSYGVGTLSGSGQPVYVENLDINRIYNRQVEAIASYPFSRVQRLEASAGVMNIAFSREVRQRVYDYYSGQLYADTSVSLPTLPALTMATASAALVYDNATWGVASPLLGQSYRLEGDAFAGSLDYFSGLADVRKYVMPVRPFTLAARVMHYGRYGRDGASNRLYPLFIGYDGLVRGYDYGSVIRDDCGSSSAGSCPAFDRLFGSKILVGNVELRFPPLGLLGLGQGLFGYLPLEAIAFADAGMAWDPAPQFVNANFDSLSTTDQQDILTQGRAFFNGGDRKPVYSAGVGLRMNVFGYLVLELDWVYPFNRFQTAQDGTLQRRGGYFHLSFTPGF